MTRLRQLETQIELARWACAAMEYLASDREPTAEELIDRKQGPLPPAWVDVVHDTCAQLDSALPGPEAWGRRVGLLLAALRTTGGPDADHSAEGSILVRMYLPVELISVFGAPNPWIDRPTQPLPDLTDRHVHSGGAINLRDLVMEIQSPLLPGRVKGRTLDAVGRAFDPVTLSAGLKLVCQRVLDEMPTTLGPQALARIDSPQFLPDVAKLALDLAEAGDWSGRMRRGDPDLLDFLRHTLPIAAAVKPTGTIEDALRCTTGTRRTHIARAWAVLYAGLMPEPRCGLMTFCRRFALASSFRKQVVGTMVCDDVPVRTSLAIQTVIAGGAAGFELRKTEDDDKTGLGDVLESLATHGAAALQAMAGADLEFRMPLTFAKHNVRRQDSSSFHQPSLRIELRRIWAVVRAVGALGRDHPDLVPLLGGVDAVGPEDSAPTWVYAAAYWSVQEALTSAGAPQLDRHFHVGEDFAHPLQGLRRIADALRFPTGVHALGHALALDEPVAMRAYERRKQTDPLGSSLRELVYDLSWLTSIDHLRARERTDIKAVLLPAIHLLSNRYQRHQMCPEAYGRLFDPAFWIRSGLLQLDPVAGPQYANTLLSWMEDDPIDAYAAELLVLDGSVTIDELREWGKGDTRFRTGIEGLPSILDRAYRSLRPRIAASVAEAEIRVESCPTSNFWLSGFESLEDIPVFRFAAEGIEVGVHTDDPGLFDTGIAREAELVTALRNRLPESPPVTDDQLFRHSVPAVSRSVVEAAVAAGRGTVKTTV